MLLERVPESDLFSRFDESELFRARDEIKYVYVCHYLGGILPKFEKDEHIVFNQDADSWMLYLPMGICEEYRRKRKVIKFAESFDDLFVKYDEIDIDDFKYLYRMTREYILFRGRKDVNFEFENDEDVIWSKSDVCNLTDYEYKL